MTATMQSTTMPARPTIDSVFDRNRWTPRRQFSIRLFGAWKTCSPVEAELELTIAYPGIYHPVGQVGHDVDQAEDKAIQDRDPHDRLEV